LSLRDFFKLLKLNDIVHLVMLKKVLSISTVLSLCLLFVLLNVTNPSSAGPFGILIVFILAYLSSLGVVTFFVYWIMRTVSYFSKPFMLKKPIERLSLRRSYYFATVIAATPIMVVGLQSVGSIGVYELLLVVVFAIIGCLYVSKRIN